MDNPTPDYATYAQIIATLFVALAILAPKAQPLYRVSALRPRTFREALWRLAYDIDRTLTRLAVVLVVALSVFVLAVDAAYLSGGVAKDVWSPRVGVALNSAVVFVLGAYVAVLPFGGYFQRGRRRRRAPSTSVAPQRPSVAHRPARSAPLRRRRTPASRLLPRRRVAGCNAINSRRGRA